ncbi:YqcI/YcgG family protein [Evansella tamaricis]|uniref:YqcI/YcgG family protein n=1 Tax=Evansella tamaricis TaxID=2069301 RepID=A0ABS6JG22_9BACI|nr:YqcI/YcgG family protein [Evansella tamaricis]MBU9712624.1 YqcI/YcgG family protein [Evansella tamaricis]
MTLYSNDSITVTKLPSWKRSALQDFEHKMSDRKNAFPCIPATQAFSFGHLRYAFVRDPRYKDSAIELGGCLQKFTEKSRSFGKYATLIVFFQTPKDLRSRTVEQFEQLFWQQLNWLSSIDKESWPRQIPEHAENSVWEFCYHGEPYFVYCATPSHHYRKSRSFPYFMLAITPRWVLTQFNSSPDYAKKIKSAIRDRLMAYDTISPHPELKHYGNEDNFEWKQYFLRDDDTQLNKCPFHRTLREETKKNDSK